MFLGSERIRSEVGRDLGERERIAVSLGEHAIGDTPRKGAHRRGEQLGPRSRSSGRRCTPGAPRKEIRAQLVRGLRKKGDTLGVQPRAAKASTRSRILDRAIRVVDHAQQRLPLSVSDNNVSVASPIMKQFGSGPSDNPNAGLGGFPLRRGQHGEPRKERTQQLVQRREPELHLRLDPNDTRRACPGPTRPRTPSNSVFPIPASPLGTSTALRPPAFLEQPIDLGTLVGTADERHAHDGNPPIPDAALGRERCRYGVRRLRPDHRCVNARVRAGCPRGNEQGVKDPSNPHCCLGPLPISPGELSCSINGPPLQPDLTALSCSAQRSQRAGSCYVKNRLLKRRRASPAGWEWAAQPRVSVLRST